LLLLVVLLRRLATVDDVGCVPSDGRSAMLANCRMLIAGESVNTDHVG